MSLTSYLFGLLLFLSFSTSRPTFRPMDMLFMQSRFDSKSLLLLDNVRVDLRKATFYAGVHLKENISKISFFMSSNTKR